MSEHINDSTITIPTFTPYAQIPLWIVRSGKALSSGAVRLYGVLKSYTDNGQSVAFPGKERISEDMGISIRSVFNYLKELEDFDALRIQQRRKENSGSFSSNIYILAWDGPFHDELGEVVQESPSAVDCLPPSAKDFPRPSATDCPIPTPNLPIPSYDPDSPPPF